MTFLARFFSCTLFLCIMFPVTVTASGLMIIPTRVEFAKDTKSQVVTLVNNSETQKSYRINFQNLRMLEDGSYKKIEEGESAEEKFADNLIRFSPRRVTLKPGESQTVRLMLVKDSSARGEYRSHLLVREEEPSQKQNNSSDNRSISASIVPIFRISIPVVVRYEKYNPRATIKEAFLVSDEDDKNKKFISVKIERSGDQSSLGDLVVNFKGKNYGFSSDVSKKDSLGYLSGVYVFYPYKTRIIKIPLNLKGSESLSGAMLDIRYISSHSEDSGKLIAQKIITLGKN